MLNKKIWVGIAVISLILIGIVVDVIAARRNEGSPLDATPLEDNIVRGVLSTGGDFWYRFTPVHSNPDRQLKVNLALVFNPDSEDQTQLATLEIYSSDQIARWYSGADKQLERLGTGKVVSRDDDPDTGELLWEEWVRPNETYYVHITNGTPVAINYWLLTTITGGPGESIKLNGERDEVPELAEETAPLPPPSLTGTDPDHSLPLAMGVNQGDLAPDSELWFSVALDNTNTRSAEPLTLFFLFTPANDDKWLHGVHMDIFPGSYLSRWVSGQELPNIGAGSLVSRDGDPITGELIWSGWLNDNETYYVRLRNNNDIPIDYWLFTKDVFHPELGEPDLSPPPIAALDDTPPSPPPNLPETGGVLSLPSGPEMEVAVTISSHSVLPLIIGLNKGDLAPGEERWLSVVLGGPDDYKPKPLKLSLFFTPGEGNRAHQVSFDIFGDTVQPGSDVEKVPNIGAGALVFRDGNSDTGELIWNGWLIGNQTYYILLRNSNNVPVEYWLFTDDIFSVELGELSIP